MECEIQDRKVTKTSKKEKKILHKWTELGSFVYLLMYL